MNVSVEQLAPCRKLLRVEVDAQAVDQAFGEITNDFQREAKLAGFRPGKAPREMVAKVYSKQIADEVKRKLISDSYQKAIEQEHLAVVSSLDIEEIQFERGQPLQFAVTIETAPDFELPEYKGIPVKRKPTVVTDADVERALHILREQQKRYDDVDRPVGAGDFVVVNYAGAVDGKPITDLAPTARGLTQQNNFWMEVKPGSFIPGFTEQLVGMKAGDHRVVEVTFPQDFLVPSLIGKKGQYDVTVVQVKQQVLPEADDAFAKLLGAENVAALRDGVRKDLENELAFKQHQDIRGQLVGGLLQKLNFDLPESIVLSETRSIVYNIVRDNQQRGVSKEMIEQQKDEIYSAASTTAKDRVRASFIFSRIAEKEGIKVEKEELAQRIYELANQYQVPVEKFLNQLKERNGVAEIQEQILSGKVLDFLEKNATIEDLPA